jgi:FixJ family two-component response regulator
VSPGPDRSNQTHPVNQLTPSVFIVDDDESVLRSLSRLMKLEGYGVRTFLSAESFLDSRPSLPQLGCLILDLQIPGLSGLELQEELAEVPTSYPVVFVSGNGDTHSIVQAMKQGAVTFLQKPFDHDELLAAVSEALDGHRRVIREQASTDEVRRHVETLTDREREVMAHVLTGALNKQIAAELGISEKTVKVHRGRVMEKMGVNSVAELIRACDRAGFGAVLG